VRPIGSDRIDLAAAVGRPVGRSRTRGRSVEAQPLLKAPRLAVVVAWQARCGTFEGTRRIVVRPVKYPQAALRYVRHKLTRGSSCRPCLCPAAPNAQRAWTDQSCHRVNHARRVCTCVRVDSKGLRRQLGSGMSETDGCGSDALTTSELSSTSSDGSANSAEAEAAELAAETGATAGDDPSSWAEPQDETLRELIAKEHHDDAVLKYHLFLGHRQVDASSRIGEIYEIMTSRLKLKCWRDITEKLQDVPTMIRGVAQSSVYLLYLTRTDDGETAGNKDGGALSYYVTIEARAAMNTAPPAPPNTPERVSRQTEQGPSRGAVAAADDPGVRQLQGLRRVATATRWRAGHRHTAHPGDGNCVRSDRG
jgi:hypothetical protein